MSDQAIRIRQAAIDAVVNGSLENLEAALRRLKDEEPWRFLSITTQLINTEQQELHSSISFGVDGLSPFFHADGVVYGATYTDHNLCFFKKAHRAGAGLMASQVREVVEKVRGEYDQAVLRQVTELKVRHEELRRLLAGHSSVDSNLASLAHVELIKGQALLVAALAPQNK
ncbi:hypothetical protein [Pseudomonas vranovensis]|uniref:Uncharacterized protein n=1 Tax=Pseudomonas vranovensis TaxID=321661 RepID=A0A423CZ54_9PSED|nr:hypothetical protein [Pseudomonas vranovensis]ROL64596.1 hypothetical protein BHU25_22205 [Pseudomonas vranovensis]